MPRLFQICSVEVDAVWQLRRSGQTAMTQECLVAVMRRLRPDATGTRLAYFTPNGPCINHSTWCGTFSKARRGGYPRYQGRYVARILFDAFVAPCPRHAVLRHVVRKGVAAPCCRCASPHHCCIGLPVAVETAWTTGHGYESAYSVASETQGFVCEEAALAMHYDFPHVAGTKGKRKAYLALRRTTLRRLANSVNIGYATLKRYIRATLACDVKQCAAHRLARRIHITAYNVCRQSGLNLCRLRPGTVLYLKALRCMEVEASPCPSVWAACALALRMRLACGVVESEQRRCSNPTAIADAMKFIQIEGARLASLLIKEWWQPNKQAVGLRVDHEESLRGAERSAHRKLVRRGRCEHAGRSRKLTTLSALLNNDLAAFVR